jgi:hypothetical protein
LVERNLAKVEVESSRLFSRSRIQKREAHKASFFYSKLPLRLSGRNLCAQHGFEFAVTIRSRGGVAKWLCSGLQSRLRRFDPDPRLHIPEKRCGAFFCGLVLQSHCARVVKLVDTADLKSAATLKRGVPVRFRSRAPIFFLNVCLACALCFSAFPISRKSETFRGTV